MAKQSDFTPVKMAKDDGASVRVTTAADKVKYTWLGYREQKPARKPQQESQDKS